MEYTFTNRFKESRLDEIVDSLRGPRLWTPIRHYPDYREWVNTVHTDLKKELKRAMIVLNRNKVIGTLIYQKHKKIPKALELKNLSLSPDERGRYLASFLTRNAEIEGQREFKSTMVVCDTKMRNIDVRFFLIKHHYTPFLVTDLYGLHSGDDIVFSKNLIPLMKPKPIFAL